MPACDQTNYLHRKRALQKAIAGGLPGAIIDEAIKGLESFKHGGFPDDWTAWTRALDDGITLARRRADELLF